MTRIIYLKTCEYPVALLDNLYAIINKVKNVNIKVQNDNLS